MLGRGMVLLSLACDCDGLVGTLPERNLLRRPAEHPSIRQSDRHGEHACVYGLTNSIALTRRRGALSTSVVRRRKIVPRPACAARAMPRASLSDDPQRSLVQAKSER
jgi:hypothetical protein